MTLPANSARPDTCLGCAGLEAEIHRLRGALCDQGDTLAVLLERTVKLHGWIRELIDEAQSQPPATPGTARERAAELGWEEAR